MKNVFIFIDVQNWYQKMVLPFKYRWFFFSILLCLSFFFPFSSTSQELANIEKETILHQLPVSFTAEEKQLFWEQYQKASDHWLYRIIPRHYRQLTWYHIGPFCLWILFGNDDDGIFGEGPRALWRMNEPPSCKKAFLWSTRNPLHNYTFYILGCAFENNSSDEFMVVDIRPGTALFFSYEPYGTTVFSDKKNCLFIAFHSLRPFISFRYTFESKKKIECFCGWRERGNFGLKMALRSEEVKKSLD